MRSRRSSEEWSKIVSAYASRSGSKEEVCKAHGIKSAALSYQLERRTSKKKFSPAQTETKSVAAQAVIEFPSGICLRILG